MSRHGAAVLLIGLLLALAPWPQGAPSPFGPASGGGGPGAARAQILNYQTLFGDSGRSGGDAAGEQPRMSRPSQPLDAVDPNAPPERPRDPDLAAYGTLSGYQPGSMLSRTTEGVSVFRQRLNRILRRAPYAFDEIERTLDRAAPDGQAGYFVGVFVVTVLLLLIGRAVVVLVAVYAFRPIMVAAQRGPPPRTLSDKLPVLALRVALTLVGVSINLLVAAGLGFALMQGHEPTALTAALVLGGYATFMIVDTCWRMVISPYLSSHRIPAMSDRDARKLYLWISTAALFGVSSQFLLAWLRELGLNRDTHALTAMALSLISVSLILAMIWSNRQAITSAILGGEARARATWLASLAAMLWAPLASLYLLAAWAEDSFRLIMGLERQIPLLAGAMLTLMLSLTVYALTVFVVEKLFARARRRQEMNEAAARREREESAREAAPPAATGDAPVASADPDERPTLRAYSGDGGDMDGDGDDEGGGPMPAFSQDREREKAVPRDHRRAGMRTFEDLARRVASLFAMGAGAYVLLVIWWGSGAFAEGTLLEKLEGAIDTLFIGYIVYQATRIWLDQKIAEEGADEIAAAPGDEGGGASAASRLATLLPLFRSGILATIGVSVALLVAVEFGVNVAPLFAGAGVVGLAIGFGAQTLVRDVLSGMFFLIDDAFRKGEYIDIGGVKGTVEEISIRSFQLRHHLGALNTVPFGEIKHLTNYSRDWVMMKLPLRLTYDTDIEKVRKLIKKLGQELLEHPTEGHKFLQPLKSQGVYMMEDSAMILRVKFMTKPGDQWTTRKLVYQRIRELFEREGIKFAAREVTVRIPDLPSDATDEEKRRAAGAAARRAVEETEPPQPAAAMAEGR